MKYFLLFCVLYSITLYADNPKRLERDRKSLKNIATEAKKVFH